MAKPSELEEHQVGLRVRGSRDVYKISAHEKDSTTIDGQLEFIAYELLNSFQAVGMFLKRAKTVEEATEAVQPYVRRLACNGG